MQIYYSIIKVKRNAMKIWFKNYKRGLCYMLGISTNISNNDLINYVDKISQCFDITMMINSKIL